MMLTTFSQEGKSYKNSINAKILYDTHTCSMFVHVYSCEYIACVVVVTT